MIDVFVNGVRSGRLSRLDPSGSSFVYQLRALKTAPGEGAQAVSLTMPLQPQSWDWDYGLLPIFEMNLPEGALRAKLRSRFAKALGQFDDIDLLSVTGRHQIGRLQYGGGMEEALSQGGSDGAFSARGGFQSVDEILRARRDGGLFEYLMERYAGRSGISGVQPKVLIQDTGKFSPAQRFSAAGAQGRASISLSSATHIVKLWEKTEYPELAANEYFCLRAAQRAGLKVPRFALSDSGEALVVERFDLDIVPMDTTAESSESGQGRYKGFEDFCVLNGVNAQDKYRGSYESKLFRRLTDYVSPSKAHEDLRALFQLFVLNVILRNGDAHLKNFGMLYTSISGEVRLAPVYDIVTTTAYLPNDVMALTLKGSTRWPERKQLQYLGRSLCELRLADINAMIDHTAQAVRETQEEMTAYFEHCTSPDIGKRMLEAWNLGLKSVSA